MEKKENAAYDKAYEFAKLNESTDELARILFSILKTTGINEAPHRKRRGIKRNCSIANPPSL